MKKLLASVAMIAFAGAAVAGGFDDAEVEGEPFVVEETGSLGSLGNGAVIGGVVLLALLAAGLGGDDDDDDDSTSTTADVASR